MAPTPDRRSPDAKIIQRLEDIENTLQEIPRLRDDIELSKGQMARMDEALFGATDPRLREQRPGILAMVNEVHTELTKRRAIGGFMKTALTLLGGGGLIGIGVAISKLAAP